MVRTNPGVPSILFCFILSSVLSGNIFLHPIDTSLVQSFPKFFLQWRKTILISCFRILKVKLLPNACVVIYFVTGSLLWTEESSSLNLIFLKHFSFDSAPLVIPSPDTFPYSHPLPVRAESRELHCSLALSLSVGPGKCILNKHQKVW